MYDYEKIKYLNSDEKQRLFNVIEQDSSLHSIRNRAIFYLAEYAGLRASEIGLLTYEDFKIDKKEIYCRRLKKSDCNTLRIIDRKVYDALMAYILYKNSKYKPSDYIFCSQKGFPISRKTLDALMKKYSLSANISPSKAHFHVLKHTRAVYLADLGLDIKEIMYWLGHKNVKSTEVYFHFTTRQQEKLYRKVFELQENNYYFTI